MQARTVKLCGSQGNTQSGRVAVLQPSLDDRLQSDFDPRVFLQQILRNMCSMESALRVHDGTAARRMGFAFSEAHQSSKRRVGKGAERAVPTRTSGRMHDACARAFRGVNVHRLRTFNECPPPPTRPHHSLRSRGEGSRARRAERDVRRSSARVQWMKQRPCY